VSIMLLLHLSLLSAKWSTKQPSVDAVRQHRLKLIWPCQAVFAHSGCWQHALFAVFQQPLEHAQMSCQLHDAAAVA